MGMLISRVWGEEVGDMVVKRVVSVVLEYDPGLSLVPS